MNPYRLRAYIQLLIVAVIWGIAGPVIKLTLAKLPADIFILYRFSISAVVALIFFLVQGIRLPKNPKTLFQLFVYCLLNSSVTLGLLFWGTSKTSLLDMSLISLFGPLLMVLFGFIFLKDRITVREKAGTFIAFLGAIVIGITPILKTDHESGQLLGNILIFASLLAGAISGVLVKKLMREDISAGSLANLSFVVGFATLLPFVLLKNGPALTFNLIVSAPFPYQLGVFYMALISGNLAYILNNMGQKTIELSEAAPFAYLYPIFSGILAVLLLGDKLTIPIIIGSVIIFVGVIIAEYKKTRYN